jgi:hypothetical protein
MLPHPVPILHRDFPEMCEQPLLSTEQDSHTFDDKLH